MNNQAIDTVPNPYPGLRPFAPEEWHLFFGREAHIHEVLRKLRLHRFVSVIGNSGSGKSSLVKAGVLPRLQNELEVWQFCTFKPGQHPLQSMALALQDYFGEAVPQANDLVALFNRSPLGLIQSLRYALPQSNKLLLIVDQFEELFRKSGNEFTEEEYQIRETFINNLLGAIGQSDLPVYVLITMRSDFIGDCEQFIGLPEAINEAQFLVPRMRKEELAKSITGPADYFGIRISPKLVQELLNAAGSNPDQLPVLQHALMRTYCIWLAEGDFDKPIDIAQYQATGTMSEALSRHAEETLLSLSESEQAKVEGIFKVLTTKGADNRGVRRPTRVKDVAAIINCEVDEVVHLSNVFRKEGVGFLMPPERTSLEPETLLDISHESLMRVWDRLAEWLEDEAEEAMLYKRIAESALLFQKGQAGLWRDPDLALAQQWMEKKRNKNWANQYNQDFDLAMSFIHSSLEEKNFLRARKTRNTRLLQVIGLVVLVVLSGLTLWALREQADAVKNEERALIEKQNALKQQQYAVEQKGIAEENFSKAMKQENLAKQNQQIAQEQEEKAKEASLLAQKERSVALQERASAIWQKVISDSLRVQATKAEEQANRLRMLSVAQTLAIKSQLIVNKSGAQLKANLALKANEFNSSNHGYLKDPEIYKALFDAGIACSQTSAMQHQMHQAAIRCVAWSKSGKWVASADELGSLVIVPADNLGANPVKVNPMAGIIKGLYFINESEILMATDQGQLLTFDINSVGSKPKVELNTGGEIVAMQVSNENLIVVLTNGLLQQYVLSGFKRVLEVKLLEKPVSCELSPEGDQWYVGSSQGKIMQGAFGKNVEHTFTIGSAAITAISAMQTGQFYCADADGSMYAIHGNGKELWKQNQAHDGMITKIIHVSSEAQLLTSSFDGTIQIRNLNQPDEKPLIIKEHESWIYSMAVNKEGSRLLTAGKDKQLRLWITGRQALEATLNQCAQNKLTQQEWNQYIGSDVQYEP